jgi:large subunit ribosomal protein L5
MADNYTPRLKTHYDERFAKLQEEFGYKNPMQVPRWTRSCSTWVLAKPWRLQEGRVPRLRIWQRSPVRSRHHQARKSIAGFKLREGMPLGVKVTLRKHAHVRILDRLITIALPRVRDFRGLNPKSFDGRGNLRHGHQGAHRVPGDRLRQGRSDLGHGRDRLHDGANDDEARASAQDFNFPFRTN